MVFGSGEQNVYFSFLVAKIHQKYLTDTIQNWNIKNNLQYFLSNISGQCPVEHLSRLKVVIKSPSGEIIDRLDPWATYVLPTPEHFYNHHFWNPPKEQV